jgi:hypothetical protein
MEVFADWQFWMDRDNSMTLFQKAITRAEERAKGHPQYQVVCRYWLDGTCSAGDRCFYLHVYDLDRVPLCAFISQPRCPEGVDCKFRHYLHPHEVHSKPRADPRRQQASEVTAQDK